MTDYERLAYMLGRGDPVHADPIVYHALLAVRELRLAPEDALVAAVRGLHAEKESLHRKLIFLIESWSGILPKLPE